MDSMQSERAKDYIFESPQSLNPYINDLLRYAFLTGTSERVLRYMCHPVKANGQPYSRSDLELMSHIKLWYDGMRFQHWVDKNNLKLYNEQNVLCVEMTMNEPANFLVHRHAQGQDKSEPKKFLAMRKA